MRRLLGAIRRKLILGITNGLLAGTRFFSLKRWLLNRLPGVELKKNVRVVAPIRITASLKVGENTWIGHDFSVEGNGAVHIGARTSVAPYVILFTGAHEIGDHSERAGKGCTGEIHVGNGCWICGAARLLPGAVVSDGAVLAAGAVLPGITVPPDTLYGGVPARLIKNLEQAEAPAAPKADRKDSQ